VKRTTASLFLVLALVGAACTGGSEGGGVKNGVVSIVMWMGYTPPPPANQAYEYTSLTGQVAAFNASHKDIHVTVRYVNSDEALQKLTVALQGNQQPDISYQYGSNMPQLATTPKVIDLTSRIQSDPSFKWSDFFPGERAVATVNGRILGVPALVDNLALVYNKDLFAKAGLAAPTANWTWNDFRAAAKALTDPAQKQFGWAFPFDGSESTVWMYDAMLWEAGGNILNAGNTQATFNSPAGTQALTMLLDLHQDGSVYLDYHPDAGKSEELFDAGKLGMMITGPWDLPSFPDVRYGVQIMPAFANHQTIAGPDNWVILDNGSARVNAAWTFLKWFTTPQNLLKDSLATGHLPTRASVQQLPGFPAFAHKYPGTAVFAANLSNVLIARPAIAAYPQISQLIGEAIQKAVLGQASPQQALDDAAQQANTILSSSP
jgi:multiple sugar transport system substrate-binding protein